MDRSAWLAALKVGDEVALRMYRRVPRIAKITHTTATQVHAEGVRFRRKDGREVGGGSYTWELHPVTDAHREAIEYSDLSHWLCQVADTFNRETGAPTLKQLRAMHSSFVEAK
jgi:hypothetical protein